MVDTILLSRFIHLITLEKLIWKGKYPLGISDDISTIYLIKIYLYSCSIPVPKVGLIILSPFLKRIILLSN